jgi:hypothetical protein
MTSLGGAIDVLEDNRTFGRTHAVSRAIAHKNRVFGQSHWMNGFMIYRDVIELIEPHLRDRSSTILVDMHKAKALARAIKSQRSPIWPTPPTTELPSKQICDDLADGYGRTIESVYRVLHIPSFRREYEALWTPNSKASMPFMIQVKLVLAIGATVYDENFSMRTEATRWVYEAQTWLSSPTFKSRLGIQYLQISILLLLARSLVDVGSELVWISTGSVIRAAIYAGLHKDPSRLPRMTVFESEMRRRIWNTILEISTQSSLESGGPALISLEDFDTAAPSNCDDEQLTAPDCVAKDDTVFTDTSFPIALRKTLPARLAVVKFLNDNASAGTFEETLRIDAALRSAYKALRRTILGYHKSGVSLVERFDVDAVEFIMLQYITSLHLPFFALSLHDPVYAYSRKAVVDSSFKIWTSVYARSIHLPGDEHDLGDEHDFVRLCLCGSGFFRTFAFHAATFLGAEVRAQIEEDSEEISSTMSASALSKTIEEAASWYLRCMEAGETGLKGYLLLKILGAQIEGTRLGLDKANMAAFLTEAVEEAVETCLRLLEAMAGQDRNGLDARGTDGSDYQVSPEFMEDWDLIMSDLFSFDSGGESFESFLV